MNCTHGITHAVLAGKACLVITLIVAGVGLTSVPGCRCPSSAQQTVEGKAAEPAPKAQPDAVKPPEAPDAERQAVLRLLPASTADLPPDEQEHRNAIENLRQRWPTLTEEERQQKTTEAVGAASDRFKCNLVQGCPSEVVLIAAGDDAVDQIIGKYQGMQSTTWTRFHLLEILGLNGSPAGVPFLMERLDDDFWNARSSAGVALATAGPAELRGQLETRMAAAVEKGDNSTAYGLAYAVAALGGAGAREVLLKALDPAVMASENTGYTRIALDALANLAAPEVCPRLQAILGHEDVFLRKSALRAAGIVRCSDRTVAEAAAESLEHRVPSVRRLAQWSLKRMTGRAITDRRTYEVWKSKGGN